MRKVFDHIPIVNKTFYDGIKFSKSEIEVLKLAHAIIDKAYNLHEPELREDQIEVDYINWAEIGLRNIIEENK